MFVYGNILLSHSVYFSRLNCSGPNRDTMNDDCDDYLKTVMAKDIILKITCYKQAT